MMIPDMIPQANSPTWYHTTRNLILLAILTAFMPLTILWTFATLTVPFPFLYANIQRQRLAIRGGRFKKNRAPRILVTGVGMTKGLWLARAFWTQGCVVYGAELELPSKGPFSRLLDHFGVHLHVWTPGRFSFAIKKFYRLPIPSMDDSPQEGQNYVDALVHIIKREHIDIWVSCSGVASAVVDGRARDHIEQWSRELTSTHNSSHTQVQGYSGCKCVQFSAQTTSILHEKDTFIDTTRALGLPVPETYNVTTRDEVLRVLDHATKSNQGLIESCVSHPPPLAKIDNTIAVHQPLKSTSHQTKKSYLLKPVEMDDKSRALMMQSTALLPRESPELTHAALASLDLGSIADTPPPDKKWVLQEYIQGEEYCTHALVINGKVKVFLACCSSDMVMHYKTLQAHGREGILREAMKTFTEKFAMDFTPQVSTTNQNGNAVRMVQHADKNIQKQVGQGGITGHLSFDFLVRDIVTPNGVQLQVLPIECNPRAHTAVALFRCREKDMVDAYLDMIDPDAVERALVVPPTDGAKIYWIGHDVVSLLFQPMLDILMVMIKFTTLLFGERTDASHPANELTTAICDLVHCWSFLLQHVFYWHDGTFELYDPLPFCWLYTGYWAMKLSDMLFRGQEAGRWTKINVSTGKVFAC